MIKDGIQINMKWYKFVLGWIEGHIVGVVERLQLEISKLKAQIVSLKAQIVGLLKGAPVTSPSTPVLAPVTRSGPKVVLVDYDGGMSITQADLVAAAGAFQQVIDTVFSLPAPNGWGVSATVRAGTKADVQVDEWVIGLFKTADQPGALGYHDRTPTGLPFSKIFPLLDRQDGVSWQSTASHELWEMLVDPEICLCAQDPNTGDIHALETADAVEAFFKVVNGVEVSDFVLPDFFQPPSDLNRAKFDWMGLVKHPFQVLAGGYDQVYDSTSGWTQIYGEKVRAAKLAHNAHSRRSQRASRHIVKK